MTKYSRSTFDFVTVGELETWLAANAGLQVGPNGGGKTQFDFDMDYIAGLDSWLLKCGATLEKVGREGMHDGTLSTRGKLQSYFAGRAWTEKTHGNKKFGSLGPKTKVKSDIDPFSLDLNPKDNGFLGDDLKKQMGIPQDQDQDLNDGLSSDEERILVTQSMVAKATDKILTDKINFATNKISDDVIIRATAGIKNKLAELDRDIHDRVTIEIQRERTEATERAAKAATDSAVTAAAVYVRDYVAGMIPNRIEIKKPNGEIKDLGQVPRHQAFEEVLAWASIGVHVYLWGPRGTGKTHLFPQVFEALDLEYTPVSQSLSKYDVLGYISATGEYVPTLARKAIEFGHGLGVDEADAWAAAALIALNMPLANKYCAFPDRVIKVHDNFLCIMSGNTTGFGATPEYQGRNPLDATSTDRVAFVYIDYDEKLEKQIFGDTPWVNYCHAVRKYVRSELKNPNAIPSMRPLQMGTKGLAAGIDPTKLVKAVLWKGLPLDTIAKIEANVGQFGYDQDWRDVA